MPEFLRRTASIAEGTKYAAVSFIGLQNLFATCALVKKTQRSSGISSNSECPHRGHVSADINSTI
jgi:hypothetical protein